MKLVLVLCKDKNEIQRLMRSYKKLNRKARSKRGLKEIHHEDQRRIYTSSFDRARSYLHDELELSPQHWETWSPEQLEAVRTRCRTHTSITSEK